MQGRIHLMLIFFQQEVTTVAMRRFALLGHLSLKVLNIQ